MLARRQLTKAAGFSIFLLEARLQQQTAQVEQKVDTVMKLMGGLGLIDIQDDTHKEPEINLFAASALNSNIFRQPMYYFLC